MAATVAKPGGGSSRAAMVTQLIVQLTDSLTTHAQCDDPEILDKLTGAILTIYQFHPHKFNAKHNNLLVMLTQTFLAKVKPALRGGRAPFLVPVMAGELLMICAEPRLSEVHSKISDILWFLCALIDRDDPSTLHLLAADLLHLLEDTCAMLQLHCAPSGARPALPWSESHRLEIEGLGALHAQMEASFRAIGGRGILQTLPARARFNLASPSRCLLLAGYLCKVLGELAHRADESGSALGEPALPVLQTATSMLQVDPPRLRTAFQHAGLGSEGHQRFLHCLQFLLPHAPVSLLPTMLRAFTSAALSWSGLQTAAPQLLATYTAVIDAAVENRRAVAREVTTCLRDQVLPRLLALTGGGRPTAELQQLAAAAVRGAASTALSLEDRTAFCELAAYLAERGAGAAADRATILTMLRLAGEEGLLGRAAHGCLCLLAERAVSSQGGGGARDAEPPSPGPALRDYTDERFSAARESMRAAHPDFPLPASVPSTSGRAPLEGIRGSVGRDAQPSLAKRPRREGSSGAATGLFERSPGRFAVFGAAIERLPELLGQLFTLEAAAAKLRNDAMWLQAHGGEIRAALRLTGALAAVLGLAGSEPALRLLSLALDRLTAKLVKPLSSGGGGTAAPAVSAALVEAHEALQAAFLALPLLSGSLASAPAAPDALLVLSFLHGAIGGGTFHVDPAACSLIALTSGQTQGSSAPPPSSLFVQLGAAPAVQRRIACHCAALVALQQLADLLFATVRKPVHAVVAFAATVPVKLQQISAALKDALVGLLSTRLSGEGDEGSVLASALSAVHTVLETAAALYLPGGIKPERPLSPGAPLCRPLAFADPSSALALLLEARQRCIAALLQLTGPAAQPSPGDRLLRTAAQRVLAEPSRRSPPLLSIVLTDTGPGVVAAVAAFLDCFRPWIDAAMADPALPAPAARTQALELLLLLSALNGPLKAVTATSPVAQAPAAGRKPSAKGAAAATTLPARAPVFRGLGPSLRGAMAAMVGPEGHAVQLARRLLPTMLFDPDAAPEILAALPPANPTAAAVKKAPGKPSEESLAISVVVELRHLGLAAGPGEDVTARQATAGDALFEVASLLLEPPADAPAGDSRTTEQALGICFLYCINILAGDLDPQLQSRAIGALHALADRSGCSPSEMLIKNWFCMDALSRFLLNPAPNQVVWIPTLVRVLKLRVDKMASIVAKNSIYSLIMEENRQGMRNLATALEITDAAGAIILNKYKDKHVPYGGISVLVMQYSHHALAQVVYRQTDRMMDALAAIEKFTGTEIFNYVQFNFKNLLQELLWWPTDDASWGAPGSPVPSTIQQRAMSFVFSLIKMLKQEEQEVETITAEDERWVSNSLQVSGHLVQTLTEFSCYFTPSQVRGRDATRQDLIRAVRATQLLMCMAGSHLVGILPQILTVLNQVIESRWAAVRAQGLSAILQVVKMLSMVHGGADLKRVASQITVMVLSAVENTAGAPVSAALAKKKAQGTAASTPAARLPAAPPGTLEDAQGDAGTIERLAGKIMEDLIVRYKRLMGETISRLPPLPSTETFRKLNEELLRSRGAQDSSKALRVLVEGLDHENPSVKLAALSDLKERLKSQRDLAATLILKPQGRALLGRLTGALLETAVQAADGMRTELAGRIALRCTECIGLLGALDPTRVVVEVRATPTLTASDLRFQTVLLARYLVRVLRSASDLAILEYTTYTIQEVLKLQGLEDAPGGSEDPAWGGVDWQDLAATLEARQGQSTRPDVWAFLPEDVQAAIRPYTHTNFSLVHTAFGADAAEGAGAGGGNPTPHFLREKTFRRWIGAWLKSLLPCELGSKKHLIRCCRVLFPIDLPTALFLVPYAVVGAVLNGSDRDLDVVYRELGAVLDAASRPSPSQALTLQQGTVGGDAGPTTEHFGGGGGGGGGEPSIITAATARSSGGAPKDAAAGAAHAAAGAGAEQTSSADISARYVTLAAQSVFSLHDTLTRVADQSSFAVGDVRGERSKGGTQSDLNARPHLRVYDRTRGLLDKLPLDRLARAALNCGANARAYMYGEQFVRESRVVARSGGLNPATFSQEEFHEDDVKFLMRAYGGLEEPDGLEGLLRLRPGSRSIDDDLLAAERAGRYGEALSLYELGLQQEMRVKAQRRAGGAGPSPDDERLSNHARGQLRCLLAMGHLQQVIAQAEGLMPVSAPQAKCELGAAAAAAAWRLGQWDNLDKYIGQAAGSVEALTSAPTPGLGAAALTHEEEWDLRVGGLLSLANRRQWTALEDAVAHARAALVDPLHAAGMDSYARAYPQAVQLHMLQELEDACGILRRMDSAGTAAGAADAPGPLQRARELRWDTRASVVQPSVSALEPLLSLRRQLSLLMGDEEEAGRSWLRLSKACRHAGSLDAATAFCLEACSRDVPGSALEYAKLLWTGGQGQRARQVLSEGIQRMERALRQDGAQGDVTSGGVRGAGDPGTGAAAAAAAAVAAPTDLLWKMKLRHARWVAETRQGSYEEVKRLFSDVQSACGRWEKAYFHLAQYLDTVMSDAKRRQQEGRKLIVAGSRIGGASMARIQMARERPWFEYSGEVISAYVHAMSMGHRHIFQCLPRMLTIWYDFGNDILAENADKSTERAINGVHSAAHLAAREVPSYTWLLALAQLTSRITHVNDDVCGKITRFILTRVTGKHPQQALWQLAAVARSTKRTRAQRASEIISSSKKHQASKQHFPRDQTAVFEHFNALVDQLIRLAAFQTDRRQKSFTITPEFASLKRMLPCSVLVPSSGLLQVILPESGVGGDGHSPLGEDVLIEGIHEQVDLLNSLMRPKKIVLMGSDGLDYPFLAKPKDDLRKDSRMMDLAQVINTLFAKDQNTRRRRLALRTYAVLPLTEECGLVEWVKGTATMRSCIEKVYQAEGYWRKGTTDEINKIHIALYKGKETVPGKAVEWLNKVLEMLPPRLHRYYHMVWTDPAAWYRARLAYTRAAACWSMVGHIVGLGDRHTENILLDTTTGDLIHIDYSCLFDKGLTLTCPEVTPFRCTQNLIDAMGVTGIEGVYRRTCEISLANLRANRQAMLSTVEAFLHDPFVDWDVVSTRTTRTMAAGEGAGAAQNQPEKENPGARDALDTIQGRVTGTLIGVNAAPSLPLNVEGQVQRLIDDATSKSNLGAMYVWWLPFC